MRIILLVLILNIISIKSFCQWQIQGLGYENPYISTDKIQVLDQNIVWTACSSSGSSIDALYFSRTTNSGANWNPGFIPSYPNYGISSISAISSDTAWFLIIDLNSMLKYIVIKTVNGGLNWTEKFNTLLDSTVNGNFHFWNSHEGIFAACRYNKGFYFYKTYDGGNNWVKIDSININGQYIFGESFTGFSHFGNSLWLITSKGRLLRSTDRGEHWNIHNTVFYPTISLYYISFQNEAHGVLYKVNQQYLTIWETNNGGVNWSSFSPIGPVRRWISWIPGAVNTCVSVGPFSDLPSIESCSYSFNGGHTWIGWDTLTDKLLYASAWASTTTGWAGSVTTYPGPSTTGIYKFTGTLLDILNIDPKIGGVKIYPNPTRGLTNMVIIGFEGKSVVINIFNNLGQKVLEKRFKQESIQSEHQLDLSNLPNGTYLTTIICDGTILKSKITINK